MIFLGRTINFLGQLSDWTSGNLVQFWSLIIIKQHFLTKEKFNRDKNSALFCETGLTY